MHRSATRFRRRIHRPSALRDRIVHVGICLAFVLVPLAHPLVAQRITGRIVAGTPAIPLGGAFVLLVDSTGAVTEVTLTDSVGVYTLTAPGAGAFSIEVRRDGATGVMSELFTLARGQTAYLDLALASRIVTLPPVTVVASAAVPTTGVLAGFYERLSRGWGYFITRDEIERRGARHIADLLHGIPDVRVIRRSELESTIRVGTELTRINAGPLSVGEDGSPNVVSDQPLRCSPILYLDGVKFGRVDDVLDQIGPSEIEGIELYRRATEVPPEFGGIYARCGVILVWTRRAPAQ